MAISQARGFGAHTGRRYGSFADKTVERPVHRLTQVRAFGAHTGRRYGAFDGRTPVGPPVVIVGGGGVVQIPPDLRRALRLRLIHEDDLLLILIASQFAKRTQ